MQLRPYNITDKSACVRMFASNVPKFFAPHEQTEFEAFLDEPNCIYFVVERDNGVPVGCGGYYVNTERRIGALCWGMVMNTEHHRGIGRFMLIERLKLICAERNADAVMIITSQHTAPFFEKSGFVTHNIIPDHYTSGLHCYEMALQLDAARCQWLAEQR